MNLELRRRTTVSVLAFFALSLALLWFMLARLGAVPSPGTRTQAVPALFANADGLTPQSDVLVHGVRVGTVTAITARGSATLVTLSLGSGTPSLRADASARVGSKTPLGEPFVDLDPGNARARLGHGAMLRARPTVEIDDALGFLDRGGRADARAALESLRQGAAAPDTSLEENQALGDLERATAEVAQLTSELSAQRADLTGLVSDGGAVLSTLAERASQLRALTAGARVTLQAVASQRSALGATLDRLPGLLGAAHQTLVAVQPLIAKATPVAAELAAAAPPLTQALNALPASSAALDRVLAQAGPIQAHVVPVLRTVQRLAAPADTALGELGPALADLVPVAQYLGPRGKTIAAWFANTADLGSHGDAKGDWARFFVMLDPSTLIGSSSGAPPGNSYTAPGDAANNQPYRPGGYPRLMSYSPALGGKR